MFLLSFYTINLESILNGATLDSVAISQRVKLRFITNIIIQSGSYGYIRNIKYASYLVSAYVSEIISLGSESTLQKLASNVLMFESLIFVNVLLNSVEPTKLSNSSSSSLGTFM